MAAANTDKLLKSTRRFSTTLGAGGIADATTTSAALTATTNLATDTAVVLTIDRVNSTGTLTPEKEEGIIAVISGSNITNMVRGFEGTAQSHSAGAVVECRLLAGQWNRLVDHLLTQHNQDGTHKAPVVTETASQTLTNKTLTSPTINTPTMTTPKVTTAHAIGTAGATETVNWANGDLQTMTLDENVTITFSNAAAGQRLTLFMLQDGTGTNTITFADTIVWQDGITWGTSYYTTTADKMNVVVIYYSGSAYFGMVGKFA